MIQTTPGNADKFEALLKEEIFIGIQNRHLRGFKGIQLLRREVGAEVEFVTIMLFDSLDAIRDFAGENYEVAVVPEKARAVLSNFDKRSQHYEIRAERSVEGQNKLPVVHLFSDELACYQRINCRPTLRAPDADR